ncbi:MAG: cupin domain-containing protein [Methanomassiliicoccales archaeon]|nr:cupin domain-containing protein [Methanomassiliicoccales archaeon]
MKLIHEEDIGVVTVEGGRGQVRIKDVASEENFVFGLRETGPNCLVPKKPHKHKLRQIMYVIEGSGTVSNGTDAMLFKAGDFIVFAGSEEHYFDSDGKDLKMIEVRIP